MGPYIGVSLPQMVSYKIVKAPNGDAWVEVRALPVAA